MKKKLFLALAIVASGLISGAQTLPSEMHFSSDGRMLILGDLPNTGLYDQSQIKSIYLNFSQPDFWNQMDSIYWTWTKKKIRATMIVDGVTYDSVGVRFKGQSSFQQIQNSQKKSFSISTDFKIPGQNLMGYKSLNLSNGYQDKSFIREIFYESMIKKHIPAVKAAYCKLYINGANWGIYTSVQQLNKTFYKEWFMSNDGSSWRAHRKSGQQTPDGDGTGALNYAEDSLGVSDSTDYQPEYKLKSFTKFNPWDDLVATCDVLNNTSLTDLPTLLPEKMDIDRTLWFLASEILFSDEDSYVVKGRADYFAYWEKETGRLTPQEYDGSGALMADNKTWSPFFNEDSVNYPLMNRLFKIPSYRQRYLAHLRTLIKENFTSSIADSIIDGYKNQIDTIVQNDPKKLYTYAAFLNEIPILKDFITDRRLFLESNSEVAEAGPVISNVAWYTNNIPWVNPFAGQSVTIRASAASPSGLYKMNLFYSLGMVGNFTKIEMFDDGMHNDLQAGDLIFGAIIPAQTSGEWVRFYVEAAANNSAKSVSYDPPGAEHNVYTYYVEPQVSSDKTIVINELMASNVSFMSDSAGEFDDWIEIYNKDTADKDLSDYILTDNSWNLDKWKFPQGTVIPSNGYIIVWADEDSSQGIFHTNFKLSASGEQLMLLDKTGLLLDSVSWSNQTPNMSYSRVPNGTGSFVIETPTFSFNNDYILTEESLVSNSINFQIWPNPNKGKFTIKKNGHAARIPAGSLVEEGKVTIYNILGELIYSKDISLSNHGKGNSLFLTIDLNNPQPGVYFIQLITENEVVNKKMVVQEPK